MASYSKELSVYEHWLLFKPNRFFYKLNRAMFLATIKDGKGTLQSYMPNFSMTNPTIQEAYKHMVMYFIYQNIITPHSDDLEGLDFTFTVNLTPDEIVALF